jgi:predicted enzyme related to lactoylglutathione lyase
MVSPLWTSPARRRWSGDRRTTAPPTGSVRRLAYLELITVVVDDQDAAIEWFVDVLGFRLETDEPSATTDGRPKRWVVVRPPGGQTAVLLACADGALQKAVVGRQTGGRVGFFLRVDDVDEVLDRVRARGGSVLHPQRDEPYGRVAVVADVAGNAWDILGPVP